MVVGMMRGRKVHDIGEGTQGHLHAINTKNVIEFETYSDKYKSEALQLNLRTL